MIQMRYTPEEVSQISDKKVEGKRGWFEAPPSIIEDGVAPTTIEERVSAPYRMVREREELLRQVIYDEGIKLLQKGSITLAEMMAILDKGRSFENFKRLI